MRQVSDLGISTGAMADVGRLSDTGEQEIYNSLANLGGTITAIAKKKMAFNDAMSDAKSVEIMRKAELDYQAKIEKDGDTNNYQKYWEESINSARNEIGKLSYQTREGAQRSKVEVESWGKLFTTTAEVGMIKQKSKDALALTESVYETSLLNDNGTTESATKISISRDAYKKALNESYSPELANQIISAKEAEFQKKATERRVKEQLVGVLGDKLDKTKGYEYLDALTKDGIINIDQNKEIGDWMDSYVAGRISKQKTTAYEKKNENLNNLGKLFTTNDVMPDDIKNAGFSEETEMKMLGYLKVANEKPNPKGTSDGFNIAAQTVAKVSTGEIATDEAYTALYEERYGNQSISNEQFLWGIDKIKNKYPKYLAAELKTTIENNNQNYNYNTRFGGSKENLETNQQLIEMVDRKLKEGQEVTGQDLAGWSARIRQTYINRQNPIYNYTIDTGNRFFRPAEFNEPDAERSMFDVPRGGVPDPQEPAPMEFPENPSNMYKKLKGTYKPEEEDTDRPFGSPRSYGMIY